MPATATDRLNGLNTAVAIKPPCRVATTANITLSGLQTVDGVALAADNRVLVKDQTDESENGIYIANTSAWTRAPDFDGALDAVDGTMVMVRSGGSVNGRTIWELTTDDTVVIGTSDLTFEPAMLTNSATAAFLQAGTGAVERTAQDKMRERITPQDFGAVADDVVDDTGAVELWLEFISTNGECGFVPAGKYRCTEKITIVGTTNFSIHGEGQEISQFIFEGGDVGFDLYCPKRTDNDGGSASLSSFSVLKRADASTWAGTAIKFSTGTEVGGNPSLTLAIDGVTVGGAKDDAGTANRFKNAIHLVNCWQAQLSNLYLTGPIPCNTSATNFGIHFEDSTGCRVVNVHCYRFQSGYYVTGSTEGPTLTNVHAVGVQDGVRVDALDTTELRPGLDITASHFNVLRYGIWATNRAQAIVKGNLFYEADGGTETEYRCIKADGLSRQWVIVGNQLTCKSGTTPTDKIAVLFEGRSRNVIGLNQIRSTAFTKGIQLGADTSLTEVVDNLNDMDSDDAFVNNSTSPLTIRYRGAFAVGAPNSIYGVTTVSIPNNTDTLLPLLDTGSIGVAGATLVDDGAVVKARIVVPATAKRVRLIASIAWAANTTGIRLIQIKKNGSEGRGLPNSRANATSTAATNQNVSTAPIDVVPGDYFTISVSQNSGGALNITTADPTWVSMEILA